jgi:protein TIF31
LHVLLPDAKTRYEVAHESFLTNRSDTLALDYALEASAMYQQVLDSPLHPQISKCLRLIGEYLSLSFFFCRISLVQRRKLVSLIYSFSHASTSSLTRRAAIAHYHKNERDLALASALKYLAVTISLHGFDSVEVLNAHLTLADILLGSGKPEGVRHVRAAHFLMEFMAGKNYAGISSQYYRMGSHYYDSGDLEGALRYYEAAASKRSEDRMFDCLIARHSAGILARLGRFKQSFDYEKKAYQLYATYLGDEHEATKACSATMVVS